MRLHTLCGLFLFLVSIPCLLAQEPTHAITPFPNLPASLFFRDKTFAIYHDSVKGNVYVSSDEGETWIRVDAIPSGVAVMVIEHPFDNSHAFVLTRSTTHYQTQDGGKTWTSFNVPIPPAVGPRPLSFHSAKYGYILYQGTVCYRSGSGWGATCYDETYVTKDAFTSSPTLLLSETTQCQFAHSGKDFKHDAHLDLIYCVAFDTKTTGNDHSLSSSWLYWSTDFFEQEKKVEDLGIGNRANGVVAFAIVSKFAVVALKESASDGGMLLYVTVDTKTWTKAQFPQASSVRLRENAYTIVESSTHSLAVDVGSADQHPIGTLFVSDSNGTFFVQTLRDTNRKMGFVDYEHIYGFESIGIANIVTNADDVEGRGFPKLLKSLITFDDGSSWQPLRAPFEDNSGQRAPCNTDDIDTCSLHLHSVTTPYNLGRTFSSPAPGIIVGVGSIGSSLLPYDECDTFLSTDAGVTWGMLRHDAHKYAFADSGSILVVVDDSEFIREVKYSLDLGQTWKTYDFGLNLRARVLTAIPSPSSQKFILLGQVDHRDQTTKDGRFVVVYLDFANTRKRRCDESDFEKWYVRTSKSECLMGTKTILVRLQDNSIWQSMNEGLTWDHKFPEERFLAFYHHKYSPNRAYLITSTNKYYATTDAGRFWNVYDAPTPPNTFGAQVLRFHPGSDKLIWTGNRDCDSLNPFAKNCHAEAQYSRNNGRSWTFIENYVVNCAWAPDLKLNADPTEIVCESYRTKTGLQRFFLPDNPLQLIQGSAYFTKKKQLFDHVVGFAKFSEFLLVATLLPQKNSLELQVSLDGVNFATGMFPPSMHPDTHAYTVLQSSTGSIFLHITMSEPPNPYWGNVLKSNSNGTYFGLSIENVNRDERGFVDFEKLIGLDGIALTNVVANPQEAVNTGLKVLQTRITYNDGGAWKPLTPPEVDSQGNQYACSTVRCALHIHGYTERADPRAIYSSRGIVGVLVAVGNVGESLAPYDESDTFLSRDAGVTWEEIHKGPHVWEFGDSGSILVMANDEQPTDHVVFSTDEGLTWREYKFTDERMRVKTIMTVPQDTTRRFILIGNIPRNFGSTVVYIDFTSLTTTECIIDTENPGQDDFELWSPSGDLTECLFGRQTLYYRRVRAVNCFVGDQPKALERIVRNCACNEEDFECELNYFRNEVGECVLVPGATPLPNDHLCRRGDDYWEERTGYRKISYSSCEGGARLDLGMRHRCSGHKLMPEDGHSVFFWFMILLSVILVVTLAAVGYWYYENSGLAWGNIRLPED